MAARSCCWLRLFRQLRPSSTWLPRHYSRPLCLATPTFPSPTRVEDLVQFEPASPPPPVYKPTVLPFEPIEGDPQSFEELGVAKWLCDRLVNHGFTAPTECQALAFPYILNKDEPTITVQDRVGTGKTLAYLLPLLQFLGTADSEGSRLRGPVALVVTPSRELGQQVLADMHTLVSKKEITSDVIMAGVGFDRIRDIRLCRRLKPPQILVATPKRMLEVVKQLNSTRSGKVILKRLQAVILDEADQLLRPTERYAPKRRRLQHEKHPKEAAQLLDLLMGNNGRNSITTDAQLVLVSATASARLQTTLVQKQWRTGSRRVLRGSARRVPSSLSFSYLPAHCHSDKWRCASLAISAWQARPDSGAVLLLVGGETSPYQAKEWLNSTGVDACVVQDELASSQQSREAFLSSAAARTVLIASTTMIRGLHLPSVECVVLLEPPPKPEALLHFAGRAGRGGEAGHCVTVVTPEEMRRLMQLGKFLEVEFAHFENFVAAEE